MGDLGFGKSFGMLESGEGHWAIEVLKGSLRLVGTGFPVWMIRLLVQAAPPGGTRKRFFSFFLKLLDDRIASHDKVDHPDITHFLYEHYKKAKPADQKDLIHMLQGDARLLVIAGSDTTAITLTHLFYYLITVPGLMERVRDEVAGCMESDGGFSNLRLQKAELFNACINETLRLHPPVPSGVPRQSPSQAVQVANMWIPPRTLIKMPWYVMGRDEAYFPRASEFIPERFSTRPELLLRRDAWTPFSSGPYNCIGKNLAYMEIRTLAARLVTRFDMVLAPGENGRGLVGEAEDNFTLGLRPFRVIVTQRE
ncbi:cytochrome P450 [Aspergillus germanicus]